MGGCARTILFVTNFVAFLAALLAVGFATYVIIDSEDYAELLGGTNFRVIAYILIGAAAFVILLTLAGCLGAWKNHSLLLIVYIILLTIVIAVEIAGAVMVFYYGDHMEDKTDEWLFDSMEDYDDDSGIRTAWDGFQQKFECCGVRSYTDWTEYRLTVPASCCEESQTCPLPTAYYSEGCLDKVIAEIEDGMDVLRYAAIALVVIQLISLCLACYSVFSITRHEEYV